MTHICAGKITIIGSDIWTNADILLIGPLGINFSEILSEIRTFSVKKMHLKMSSGIWRPFCLGLNVLKSKVFLLPQAAGIELLRPIIMKCSWLGSCGFTAPTIKTTPINNVLYDKADNKSKETAESRRLTLTVRGPS